MKKLLFVFNPNSGKGQIKNHLMGIVQLFSNSGYEVTLYPTKKEKDGYRYILENISRYDLLVVSGGDGTLNETVNAMMEYTGKRMPIGYIPSGTTNDFAVSLNIPKDMLRAAEHIVNGEPVACDIGLMNRKKYFNYVAAFGAFTAVSYATPQSMKNILGHQAYVIEGVKSLTTMRAYKVRLQADSAYAEGDYVFGMVSNAESIGGLKGLAGNYISLKDGLFEVTMIRQPRTPMDIQQLVTAFISQNIKNCDLILSVRAKHIEVECTEPIHWTLDGEYGGESRCTVFDVLHNAVEFMVQYR